MESVLRKYIRKILSESSEKDSKKGIFDDPNLDTHFQWSKDVDVHFLKKEYGLYSKTMDDDISQHDGGGESFESLYEKYVTKMNLPPDIFYTNFSLKLVGDRFVIRSSKFIMTSLTMLEREPYKSNYLEKQGNTDFVVMKRYLKEKLGERFKR